MRLLLTLLIPVSAACSSFAESTPNDDLALRVEPAPATAGDTIELILENASATTVGYNLCASALERRAGGGWQAVPSDRVCTMELRTLAPGATDRFPIDLPADLPEGEYRAVTTVELMESGRRQPLASEPFRVR